jgi:hypothetical protein
MACTAASAARPPPTMRNCRLSISPPSAIPPVSAARPVRTAPAQELECNPGVISAGAH